MSKDTNVTEAGRQQIFTMVRWLLYLVFVVIGYWILSRLGPVLAPLLAAAAIAYMLDPLVDRLESRGVNRSLAVGLLLGSFVAFLSVVLIILIPWVAHDIGQFAANLPMHVTRFTDWIEARLGVQVPDHWQELMAAEHIEKTLSSWAGPAAEMVAAAVGGLFSVLGFFAEFLLIPVFAFYFLVDWDPMMARLHRMVPPRHRKPVGEIASEIDQVVSSWIRGQFTVTCILTILYAVAFEVIGVHLAVTVGAIVGALTIIPFVGTFVGAIMTGCILAIDYNGPTELLAVGAVFVVLHLLEAGVLTPKIVGHRVGLSEVGALFAVLGGGKLLGFAGVLLAVPIAAAVAVLVRRAVKVYEKSDFFKQEEEDSSLIVT